MRILPSSARSVLCSRIFDIDQEGYVLGGMISDSELTFRGESDIVYSRQKKGSGMVPRFDRTDLPCTSAGWLDEPLSARLGLRSAYYTFYYPRDIAGVCALHEGEE